MTKKQNNLILIAVAVLVTFLGVGGYFNQKQRDSDVSPKIISELIVPYSKALKNKDYKTAYYNFTTEDYQNSYSFEIFKKAQEENIKKYGDFIDIKPLSGLFLTQKRMHKPWRFVGTLRYRGLKKQERIQVEVSPTKDGRFLINNTFLSLLQYDPRSNEPMIF